MPERLAVWRETVSQTLVSLDAGSDDVETFHGEIRSEKLGDLRLSK